MTEFKYIVEAKYKNGDKYADKFDTLEEVNEILAYINTQASYNSADSVIHDNQVILADTIHIYTEDQDTGALSYDSI